MTIPDESTCYELPLSPQHLVQIYKDKNELEEYVLWVDYAKSKEKLSAQHIIIYLANTNFKTTFSSIDEDLIKAYINSDFMVDCPLLARIVVLIIKFYYKHDISEQESQLLYIFPPKLIFKFIEENSALVESLIDTVASSVPFALSKLYDGLTDDQKELEVNLKQLLDDTKVVDKPAMCGPNIARLLTTGYDALLLIVSKRGLSTEYNKQIYNDSPKYFGRDLYNVMCESKITDQIVSFFPEDFMLLANDNET
jgi:hypothetical protein